MRTTRGMGMQRRHPVLWATLVLACGLCTSPGKGSCGVVSSEPDAQAMALAQEIRRDDNLQSRVQVAAYQLRDERLLAALAREDDDPELRFATVQNVTDRRLLIEIIRHDGDWSVRSAALARIPEPAFLAEVALRDPKPLLRAGVGEKIDDQATLLQVARHDVDPHPRSVAVQRLQDRGAQAEIARSDVDASVRRAAVLCIEDQKVLAQIAIGDSDPEVRWAALIRIEPGPWLRHALSRSESAEARLWAAASGILAEVPAAPDELGRRIRVVLGVVAVQLTTDDKSLSEIAATRANNLRGGYYGDGYHGAPVFLPGWPDSGLTYDPPLELVLARECERTNALACAAIGGLKARGLFDPNCWGLFRPPREAGEGARLLERACDAGVTLACRLATRVHTTAGVPPTWCSGIVGRLLGPLPPNVSVAPPETMGSLTERCARGDWRACYTAGDLTAHTSDPAQAVAYYERACTGGIGEACLGLGEAPLGATDGHPDASRVRAAFDAGCKARSRDACRMLAASFGPDSALPPNAVEERAAYSRACAVNDQPSCHALGDMQIKGRGGPVDVRGAMASYEGACPSNWPDRNRDRAACDALIRVGSDACSKGDATACLKIGNRLQSESSSSPEGPRLLSAGCDAGLADACVSLANVWSVHRSDVARKLWAAERACSLGSAAGCDQSATLWERRAAVGSASASHKHALRFLEQGCAASYRASCETLAEWLVVGWHVPKDRARALRIRESAARMSRP